MVIDSSVIIAIALKEAPWESLSQKAASAPCIVAAPTLLETYMVLKSRMSHGGREAMEDVVSEFEISIVPFGHTHFRAACEAFDRFGKGRHPASLNFGDCMSYALSKVSGQPLLYVGDDFSKTDVARA